MLAQPDKAITLVLGGARSGKSRYAQQLARACRSVTFIATALPCDAEMRERILAHQSARPQEWRTLEASTALPAAIREASTNSDVILIDCLTTYLGNQMMDSSHKCRALKDAVADLDADGICAALQSAESSVVVVSNEVGSGIVPQFRSGRIYRDLLGELNQRIAGIADRVIFMVAGQPLTIKGGELR